jgi:Fur family transcriptional regulator, ferric uptake regulator
MFMMQTQTTQHATVPVLAHAKIIALMRATGLRITQPRISILTFMHQHPTWHIGVEDLYVQLLEKHEAVTLATCYRVLHEFVQAGLINRRVLNEGRSVYEIAKETHHDHMVQEPGGMVLGFREPRLDTLLQEIASQHGFAVVDRQLVLYVRVKDGGNMMATVEPV